MKKNQFWRRSQSSNNLTTDKEERRSPPKRASSLAIFFPVGRSKLLDPVRVTSTSTPEPKFCTADNDAQMQAAYKEIIGLIFGKDFNLVYKNMANALSSDKPEQYLAIFGLHHKGSQLALNLALIKQIKELERISDNENYNFHYSKDGRFACASACDLIDLYFANKDEVDEQLIGNIHKNFEACKMWEKESENPKEFRSNMIIFGVLAGLCYEKLDDHSLALECYHFLKFNTCPRNIDESLDSAIERCQDRLTVDPSPLTRNNMY